MPLFNVVFNVAEPPGGISFDFGPPTIVRSCAILPVFLIWNVTGPACSVAGLSVILNSVSLT